ncbi:acyltransferase family protein [Paraburkholderia sp. LEh10]|uniref:acyltransferase family protein n=1 Tax=Paraburkholderia sp. LEh10 TaxID=2821353 RepID=UPI001AE3B1EC|nr:acyltransferase family protein [Paraburkholderia sp. LEh10]MBP0593331.1 acyltransferase family protein [Paraburkholderia sp. LEh10]
MSGKLNGIQALRALAAIAVVALHFNEQIGFYDRGGAPRLLTSGVAYVGASGVDIFFVISGFIMYCTRAESVAGAAAAANFLWRSAVRILPLTGSGEPSAC